MLYFRHFVINVPCHSRPSFSTAVGMVMIGVGDGYDFPRYCHSRPVVYILLWFHACDLLKLFAISLDAV